MKKYIIIALCIINPLNAMELSTPQREPREWDAQAYAQGNKMQAAANGYFLTKNNIQTKGLNILEIGCGTGEQAKKLSLDANHIHAIDASKNMIDYAENQYHSIKNISFEHCFAEDFISQKKFQLALASCCFHYFEDKKQALQRINDHLEINGQFFANIQTADHPKPFTLIVFHEMLQEIPMIGKWISTNANPTGQSYPTNDELDAMLQETGFDIIKRESQSFDWTDEKEELRKWLYPIITSRPAAKLIPDLFLQPLLENFFDRCLKKLVKNDDGTYTWTCTTEIVHARKVKK